MDSEDGAPGEEEAEPGELEGPLGITEGTATARRGGGRGDIGTRKTKGTCGAMKPTMDSDLGAPEL